MGRGGGSAQSLRGASGSGLVFRGCTGGLRARGMAVGRLGEVIVGGEIVGVYIMGACMVGAGGVRWCGGTDSSAALRDSMRIAANVCVGQCVRERLPLCWRVGTRQSRVGGRRHQ